MALPAKTCNTSAAMASSCTIEEPQVLLSLPRPLDPAESNVSVAPVFGLAQSRKRKRPELVVGIDGECVNVYDVKTPRLISSHAISQQTRLTAAPCCLYQRGRARAARRFTYAAVRNNLGAPQHHLFCFREDILNRNQGAAVPVKTSTDLGAHNNPVVHIESHFPDITEENESHEILAIQQDGTITCLTEDVSETKWASKLQASYAPQSSGSHVDYVRSFDGSEAIQGIFKDRPEVLAVLQPTATANLEALRQLQILFTTTHTTDDSTRQAHAYCIRPVSSVANQRSIAQHLCTWDFSVLSTNAQSVSQQSLDPRNGVFQLRIGSTLVNYDLSSSAAHRISTFSPIPSSSTFLPVSAKLSLISSKTSCQLYDIHYKSLQAVQTASAAQAANAGSRKRKRVSLDASNQPVRLVQYFARLGLAIGLLGNDVIGYPVKLATSTHSKLERGSRLFDAIGRAAPSASTQEQDETLLSLLQMAEKRDTTGFEKLFFQLVSPKEEHQAPAKLAKKLTESKTGNSGSGLTEDHVRRFGSCALAAIFSRDDAPAKQDGPFGSSDGVRVKFLPTNVFRWLSLYQLVRPENISRALQHKTSPTARLRNITYEGIATAVAAADPSLALLSDLVIKNSLVSHTGLVRALRILLRSFDNPQMLRTDRMLTNGDIEDIEDPLSGTPENQVEVEESAAQWDLDIASIMLEDGPSGRGLALRICCEKLAGGSTSKQVVRALRDQMSRRDLALLIELLRFELANGGWTSRCLDFFPNPDADPVGQDEIIWVICELLNRALDALGTGGWLGFGTGPSTAFSGMATPDDDSEQADDEIALIHQLREDASAVVEGVQESSFFTGFLRDFIRFSEAQRSSARRGGAGPGTSKGGEITTAAEENIDPILPLGLKSVQRVGNTRIGAGGEIQKRSRRDIAAKLGKQVGVYSFETIRV
ncbi:hypothetical protein FH972_024514 [Carpinus fangiana]|uniref:Utp8 beta-propeller domain-containing protein n=1 Tax=Carpinus fangiana TaxID=176857 RepID=A0A5N6KYM1_9ROSI|nr:hypothetical protein FH972_024514 [Carpinus fangiana]